MNGVFSVNILRGFLSVALMGVSILPAGAVLDHSLYSGSHVCLECHPRALPTHLRARPEKMPEGLKAGPGGEMTCITCHDCSTGICALRKKTPDLCRSCHDCSKGMGCVLGVAHLGSKQGAGLVQNCLACHDGVIAKTNIFPGTAGGHKVDVYYMKKKDFNIRPDRRIIFVGGKVTCISCHNPYKNERSRLVMSNVKSSLCLSCHIK